MAADPEEEPVVEVDSEAVTEEAPFAAKPEEEPVVEVSRHGGRNGGGTSGR